MATSGATFWLDLQQKYGKDYSAYYDNASANAVIAEAIVKCVEKKYSDLTSEKRTDELFTLIRTNVAYTPVSNQVSLTTVATDYLHLLALKATFEYQISNVTDATNQTPIVLTLNTLNNLRDGEQIIVSGVLGNTNANGTRFVKKLYDDFLYNKFTYQLFSDAKLTIPIAGNGTYTSGGTATKVLSGWTKKKNSYRKISVFGEPTLTDAFWEISGGVITILPTTENCTSVAIDYVKKITVPIDVANTTTDLELSYSKPMLYAIADETAMIIGEQSRDGGLIQNEMIEIRQE